MLVFAGLRGPDLPFPPTKPGVPRQARLVLTGDPLLGSARLSRRFAFLAPRGARKTSCCKQVEPGGTRQGTPGFVVKT